MAIRIALGHIDQWDEATASFASQLGIRSVQFHTPSNLSGTDGFWNLTELRDLRDSCDAAGLVIEGLENVPYQHFDKVQRGEIGRDEQIDNYCRTIRNMAAAGIMLLGYHFMPTYVWRTAMGASGRGGARITSFDLEEVGRGNALAAYKLTPARLVAEPISAAQMWENHQYFLDAVLPVAEHEGVRLALHPDDPPVREALGGAARIFNSPGALAEAYRQAGGSPAWGLNLCLGTVSEMSGEDGINEVIDFFGPRGAICYVHFRDVRGTVPRFAECFLGEGNFEPARVIRRLDEAGFDSFLIDDHVPAMIGDVDTWGETSSQAYCSRGRAHAIGYLQGVLAATGLGG